jgi:hypothetical protein
MPALMAPMAGVLPHTGLDGSSNMMADLREHFLPAAKDVAEPDKLGWQISAALDANAAYDGNIAATGGSIKPGADEIFALTPMIGIMHPGTPLDLTVVYAPVARFYAQHNDQSYVAQNLNGNAQVAFLPGFLYLSLAASASEQAALGGASGSNATLNNGNRANTQSFSASPFITHGFADAGTLQAGYGYIYSNTAQPNRPMIPLTIYDPLDVLLHYIPLQKGDVVSTDSAGDIFINGKLQTFPLGPGNQTLRTNRVFATFNTGDGLDRLQAAFNLEGNFYDGTGSFAGARRVTGDTQLSYALTRGLSLVGEGGYESLDYPQIMYRYRGPTGAGGLTVRPNADSTVTLEYRYNDGQGGVFSKFTWALSPRIHLFGGYSQGIGSDLQDVQNTLLSGDTDARGLRGNMLTAGPFLPDSGFAPDANVSRAKRFDASAAWLFDRDTVTLSVARDRTTPLGTPISTVSAGTAPAQPAENDALTCAWQHQLNEQLSLNVSAGYLYAQSQQLGGGETGSVTVDAGLSDQLSPKLRAYWRYDGRFDTGGTGMALNYGTDNTIVIGIARTFL